MPIYRDLLQSDYWKVKREEIIKRDNNKCQHCFNKSHLEYNLSTFSLKPSKGNSTIINIHNSNGTEVFTERNFTFYSSLKSSLKDILIVVYEEDSTLNKVIGFFSTNISISENEVDEEIENNINNELLKFEPHRREAIRYYLKSYDPPRRLIISKLIEKKIKASINNLELNALNWSEVKNLHVHHKYYQMGKLPWDYPDEALITLCWRCHEGIHRKEKTKWLNENGQVVGSLTPCLRCFGAGVFPEFNHVQNGICFRCDGAKYEEFITNQ
ncbi:hypothetical protein ACWA1C_15810 [Flectobacillus roseus]